MRVRTLEYALIRTTKSAGHIAHDVRPSFYAARRRSSGSCWEPEKKLPFPSGESDIVPSDLEPPALCNRMAGQVDQDAGMEVDALEEFLTDLECHNIPANALEAEETSTGVRGNDQDGVIPIRAAAASLAFSLSHYFQQSGLNEPEAIRRWRELCTGSNEFAEVKNAWLVAAS